MGKHDHKECDHVIKFCKHCNVCYCELCGKEWKDENPYTSIPLQRQWPGQISNPWESPLWPPYKVNGGHNG